MYTTKNCTGSMPFCSFFNYTTAFTVLPSFLAYKGLFAVKGLITTHQAYMDDSEPSACFCVGVDRGGSGRNVTYRSRDSASLGVN